MIFGSVVAYTYSLTLYFCSIDCCRHYGSEPVRMLLPGEHIGKHCTHCGVALDVEEPVEHAHLTDDIYTPSKGD